MTRPILTLLGLIVLAPALAAQETPPGEGGNGAERLEAARDELAKLRQGRRTRAVRAFEVFQRVEASIAKVRAQMSEAKNTEARREASGQHRELRDTLKEARALFAKAFAQCDWQDWQAADAPELVELGLSEVVATAMKEGNGADAVAAGERLVAECPESSQAKRAVGRSLPSAYLLAFPAAEAREKISALLATTGLDDAVRRGLHQHLGDLYGLEGDFAAASMSYAAALEGIPEELDRRDPLLRLKKDAGMRAALVGQPPPDFASFYWLGGEKSAVGDLTGQVTILDFWATWCPPCRAVMPHLEELSQARQKDGLSVVGVTRRYNRGWMPNENGEGGESVRGLDDESFDVHLRDFRARFGSTYPYAVVADAAFTDYRIRGIPSLFVLDRKGVVRYIKVGSGSERVLDKVVDLLLAE